MNMRVQVLAVLSALMLTACASGGLSAREKGALGGGALGAGAGAILRPPTCHAGAGAAIGGALGGVGGAVVGDRIQAGDERLDAQEQELARNRALIEELKRKNLEVRETKRGVVVNLPDVLFEFNKATLTSDARRKIGDVADTL